MSIHTKLELKNWKALLLLFLFLMGISSCGLTGETREIELNTLNFSPLYELALSNAQGWQSDAYLVQARLPIWAGDKPDSVSSSFGFRSSSDRAKWLIVRINPKGSEASEVELFEGVYESERPAASSYENLNDILTSSEALSIISNNGGAQFVHEHGDAVDSYLLLKYSQDYYETLPLEWVGHFHLLGQTPGLVIKVNAHNGELIDIFDPTE